MPKAEECNKIADPVERRKCKTYQGKYAKKNPVKKMTKKPAGPAY